MYNYESHRQWLTTEEGARAVGMAVNHVEERLDPAGAATMARLMPMSAPDSWRAMATVDYLVECGVLLELEQVRKPAGQDRVFIRRPR